MKSWNVLWYLWCLLILMSGIQAVSAEDGYKYVTQWGFDTVPFGETSGVVTDHSNNIFIVDSSNNRIQKLSPNGTHLATIGGAGSGNGQFDRPIGIAIDQSGCLYVVDSDNNRIQKFSSTGTFIKAWGTKGSGNGQFDNPQYLAVDRSGNIYVSDNGNNRIQKFDSTGIFLTAWGSEGVFTGQFNGPEGIAVDSTGNVYVADYGNNRIQKFTPAGVFIRAWGGSGQGDDQFSNPICIQADHSGNIYLAQGSTLKKFSSTGTFLKKITIERWKRCDIDCLSISDADAITVVLSLQGSDYSGNWGGFVTLSPEGTILNTWGSSNPFGIATDSEGNVYVTDTNNQRIRKFTSNGIPITMWGECGTGNGQFLYPMGVAVAPSGNVYVADWGNRRIQEFSSNGTFIAKQSVNGNPCAIAIKGGIVYNSTAYSGGFAFDSAGNWFGFSPYDIVKISPTGKTITRWGGQWVAYGGLFNGVIGFAVDANDNVYVTDVHSYYWGEDRVLKFSSSGTLLGELGGGTGSEEGEFDFPCGIAVDRTGNIIVADTGNNRVQKFAPLTPPILQVPTGIGIPTDTDEDAKVDDVNGNGRKDFADVVLFFNQMSWIAANEPLAAFDYNGNGRIDFADVVWLFNHL